MSRVLAFVCIFALLFSIAFAQSSSSSAAVDSSSSSGVVVINGTSSSSVILVNDSSSTGVITNTSSTAAVSSSSGAALSTGIIIGNDSSTTVIQPSSSAIVDLSSSSSGVIVVNDSSSSAIIIESSSSAVEIPLVSCSDVIVANSTTFFIGETTAPQFTISEFAQDPDAMVQPNIFLGNGNTYFFNLQNLTDTFAITQNDPANNNGFAAPPFVLSGTNGTVTFIPNLNLGAQGFLTFFYAAPVGSGQRDMGARIIIANFDAQCPALDNVLGAQSGFTAKASIFVTIFAVVLAVLAAF